MPKSNGQPTGSYKPWFNSECKKAVKASQNAMDKCRTNPSSDKINEYKISRTNAHEIIKERKANNKELRIGMYANDTFLILDSTEKSLTGSLHILESFYKCSELKTNMSKTQALWLDNSSTKPQFLSKFN